MGKGTATVEVTGTGRFTGEFGTDSLVHAVEGGVDSGSSFTIEIPYGRSDYVSAYARLAEGSSLTTKIRAGCRIVAKGKGLVAWKPPRSWEEGLPPEDWSKCASGL